MNLPWPFVRLLVYALFCIDLGVAFSCINFSSASVGVARAPSIDATHTILKTPQPKRKRNAERILHMFGTDESDGFGEESDPDLVGVYVDGFPLPKIPTRTDDEKLLASMRRVPVQPMESPQPPGEIMKERPLRVIIAGGGLGGLSLASNLISKGSFDVHIYEQARQYKPFGGPIQIQSNALWALREMNPVLYSAVEKCGVQTGDRLSGIKDGIRYEEGWLVKFDAASPAIRCGLPLTLAINRVALQEIFLKYGVPEERVHTSNRVLSYENLDEGGVAVALEDGTTVYGDILIGADGIWSRIRHQMYDLPMNELGPKYATKHAKYSGYTCFTGTCKHTPEDIEDVAYKVFLGQEQYFGCTDTGHGWQHWWAFLPDPPGAGAKSGIHNSESMLDRLRIEFHGWSPEIHDLFDATKEEVVKRRDLFDRQPLWGGWVDGAVALMGDAAHPTMPNLGQGGAMAIEDAYVLGEELDGIKNTNEIKSILKAYERRRFFRASVAQFLSRNGSDLLSDWEKLRTTPVVGEIAMKSINVFQPLTMDYLYSSKF
jgi:zeaxanthin epoxidase